MSRFSQQAVRDGAGRAFTLVEMLVAVAVLVILGVVIAQIVGATGRTIRLSNQIVDAASQARLALDRLGLDLGMLVRRPDIDFEARNGTPGAVNLLAFVSGVNSPLSGGTNRGASVVTYQVNTHADNKGPDGNARACLVRAGKGIHQTDTGFFGLSAAGLPVLFTDPAFPAALTAQAADYDILAPGVIRLVVGFQLYPDDGSATLLDGTAVANATGQIVYSPPVHTLSSWDGSTSLQVVDLNRIAALVVGVAALDSQSLKPLTSTQVSALATAFPTPDNGKTPARQWAPLASQAATLPAAVPLAARQAVRVFQRFYLLNPYHGATP